jgi:hypothetical protein
VGSGHAVSWAASWRDRAHSYGASNAGTSTEYCTVPTLFCATAVAYAASTAVCAAALFAAVPRSTSRPLTTFRTAHLCRNASKLDDVHGYAGSVSPCLMIGLTIRLTWSDLIRS